MRVVVAGGGLFGLAAACELVRRGHGVVVIEPGPLPHPEASSTDVSKAVRMDYAADELYVELAERSMEGWRELERRWRTELYHEVGFALLCSRPMREGDFEWESYRTLSRRGLALERLDEHGIAHRFPALAPGSLVDGYLNPRAGWVESGRAIGLLAEEARALGVELVLSERAVACVEEGGHVRGFRTDRGRVHRGDRLLVAGGAWSAGLLPELAELLRPVAQPVFHFQIGSAAAYRSPELCVFGADIARAGWYGFPALADGRFKVGHHGRGFAADPAGERRMPEGEEGRFRAFLARCFPGASRAPVALTRLCFYCDTADGDFWIDHHPDRPGLVVAAGGSGHAFKFLPVLGAIVADVLEAERNSAWPRFAWRTPAPGRREAARAD